MSKTRTPPPFQPVGWEKSDKHVDIQCTESEKLLWKAVWGNGKSADSIRLILNHKAYEVAGVKRVKPLKLTTTESVAAELNRHAAEMRRLARLKR
jgi:hypothetical protein